MVTPAIAAATDYYIDFANGIDTNLGTSSMSPWKHCPGDANASGVPAGKNLVPGDRLVFRGGVVYIGLINVKWSGNASNDITYDGNSDSSWGAGKAIIDGNNVYFQGFYGGASGISRVAIRNFEIRNQLSNAAKVWDTAGIRFPNASSYISISDCYIHDLGYWKNDAIKNPSGEGISGVSSTSWLIRNNEITKTGGAGISLDGPQAVTIENNNIHDYINWGIDIVGDARLATNNLIRGNSIHDLYMYDSGYWGGAVGTEPHQDFIFIRKGNGTRPNGNVVDGNLFYNNLSFTNSGGTAQLFLSYADNTLITNNVFINPHSYYTVSFGWGSSGNLFYNNTIYSPRTGAISLAGVDGIGGGNNKIKNNIIVSGRAIEINNTSVESGLESDYNVYWQTNDLQMFHNVQTSSFWTYNSWRSRSFTPKLDLNSIKVANISDIKFIDTAGYPTSCQSMDLRIKTDSPAINKGMALPNFRDDATGATRPIGTYWDIGAFETSLIPPKTPASLAIK